MSKLLYVGLGALAVYLLIRKQSTPPAASLPTAANPAVYDDSRYTRMPVDEHVNQLLTNPATGKPYTLQEWFSRAQPLFQ